MISPSEQEKQTQDHLRGAAMEHLLSAADCALAASPAERRPLVLAAARELWNVALAMMG